MYGTMLIKLPWFGELFTGVTQLCAVWGFAQAFCMLDSWGGRGVGGGVLLGTGDPDEQSGAEHVSVCPSLGGLCFSGSSKLFIPEQC